MGSLPPVFIEFLGKSTGFKATAAGVKTELAEVEAEGGGSMARLGAVSKAALLGIGVAAGVVAVKTVHMAADFQTQMTRVRTGAGELAGNMSMVSKGVLAMAGQVGQSTSELTSGLYMVESAGYHGADALNVLRVSAQGAKVGAADMASVTDATTTALNAYKLGAGDVTNVMNALVATESEGKTNMEALAGSMSSILPVAASAHVGLNEVLGAMATMTSQGTAAKVAATYLRQTIGMLSNPSAKAAGEMKDLGLNSTEVAQNLGKNGLASTLNMLTDAIENHMGPAGTVLINKLQSVSGSATEFQKVLANLPPEQQTYIGALATMVGGTKSMMGALELTGTHMDTFNKNVAGVAQHVKDGGKSVEGWADVQKTFNQRVAEAKGALEAIGIEIGTALLPTAMKMISVFASTVTWFTKHKLAAEALGAAIGGILVLGLVAVTVAVWNFTVALLANPVTWVVIGIMALIAAIVLLVVKWQTVANWLSGVWSSVVHGLGSLWNWLASETASVWNNGIVGPLRSAWNMIVGFFVGAYNAVANPLIATWNAIANFTRTVWNAIAAFFVKWWPLLLVIFLPPIALLLAIWNHFHTQIESAARTTWNAVASFFTAIWSAITTAASTAWNAFYAVVIAPVVAVYKYIQGKLESLAKWLVSIWHSISGAAGSGASSIKNALTGPINTALSVIRGIVNKIKSAISSGMNGALSAAKSVAGKFESVGRAIVSGMVKGVESLAGSLASSVKNTANNALKGAKSFLGINSPSRVFADQVGKWIPAGIAAGVAANSGTAHSAVTALAAGLVVAAAPSFGSSRFGPNATSFGGASTAPVTQTVVHVHVAGSVMAENDLKNTVQKVMLQTGARNSASYAPFKR